MFLHIDEHRQASARSHARSRIRNSDLSLIPDLFEQFLTAGFEMKQEVSAVVTGQLPLSLPARFLMGNICHASSLLAI